MRKNIAVIAIIICLLIGINTDTLTCYAISYSNHPQYPYVNLLSQDQLTTYNQIYQNILNYNQELFTLEEPLSESSLEDTMNAIYNDHPELFWVNTSYQYAIDSAGIVRRVKLRYCIDPTDYTFAQVNYNSTLSSLVEEARTYPTKLEQERFLHDSICQMNTYNSDNSLNQSSYSALTCGSSVCAGYARAFQVACHELGITCYYVTGTSMGSSHAWNIVEIDGHFYNVDLTWDDAISEATGIISYAYFNKSDASFNLDHSRSSLSAQLIACN